MKTFKSLAEQFSVSEKFLNGLADRGLILYTQVGPNRFADPEEVARALVEHRKEAEEILGQLIQEAQAMGMY